MCISILETQCPGAIFLKVCTSLNFDVSERDPNSKSRSRFQRKESQIVGAGPISAWRQPPPKRAGPSSPNLHALPLPSWTSTMDRALSASCCPHAHGHARRARLAVPASGRPLFPPAPGSCGGGRGATRWARGSRPGAPSALLLSRSASDTLAPWLIYTPFPTLPLHHHRFFALSPLPPPSLPVASSPPPPRRGYPPLLR